MIAREINDSAKEIELLAEGIAQQTLQIATSTVAYPSITYQEIVTQSEKQILVL